MKYLKIVLIFILCHGLVNAQTQQSVPTKNDIRIGNLTDEEKLQQENFKHEGYLQRELEDQIKEECGDDISCEQSMSGSNATSGEKFMGMSPEMIQGLSKAYTMVMGASELGSKMERSQDGSGRISTEADEKVAKIKLNAKTEDGKSIFNSDGEYNEGMDESSLQAKDKKAIEENQEEKEGEDYCRFIAMGTEVVAMATNKNEMQNIEQTPSEDETGQEVALQKTSRAHASRARSLNTQVIGWGASTACYVASLSMNTWKSYKNVAKLAASTLMWRYYTWEQGVHKDAKSKVDKIISKLSKPGACNPVDQRDCYCSQPETMNDTKWCMPQIRQRVSQNSYQVTCVDENLKEDLGCSCTSNDTCLDKRVKKSIEMMQLPPEIKSNLSPFFAMTKGQIKGSAGQYGVSASSDKLFAKAQGLLRNNESKLKKEGSLPKDTKDAVEFFSDLGLTKTASKAILASKASPQSKKNMAKFDSGKKSVRYYKGGQSGYQKKSNVLTFSGGDGINGKKTNKARKDPYASFLKKMKKGKTSSQANGSVMKFARQASARAAISQDKSEKIFDIISRRYQVTAKKRLEID